MVTREAEAGHHKFEASLGSKVPGQPRYIVSGKKKSLYMFGTHAIFP